MGEQSPVTDPCPVGPRSGFGPDSLLHCPWAPGARPKAGDTAKGWEQGLGSPCSSMGLGCPKHPWGCGSFSPSTHQSLSPCAQTPCEDMGGDEDKRGLSRRTVPGPPPVLPRHPCDTQGGGGRQWRRCRPPPCSSLRLRGPSAGWNWGVPRRGDAGDVPAPPAGACSCRPGNSVIFIRGKQ